MSRALTAVEFLADALARALPRVLSVIFKLTLEILVFWFFVAFAQECWSQDWMLGFGMAVAIALTLFLSAWKVVDSYRNRLQSAELRPFAGWSLNALIATALLAVVFATWYGHTFNHGLLKFTQIVMKRAYSYIF